MLNSEVLQRFQTQIDKINEKIENWLRKQSIFISIYKDVITNYSDNKSLAEWNQNSITSEKEISNKKIYNKLMLCSCKQNRKRKERTFWETDRSFKSQRSVQSIEIPSTDEWDLKFSPENEEEISQILYFGYKDSLFYNKSENKWHKDFQHNRSNRQNKDINDALQNYTT